MMEITSLGDAFKLMDMICNFDPRASKLMNVGLRDIIPNPHNLYTIKDKDGNITTWKLELVYTPFTKEDISVKVVENYLQVEIGRENKKRDDDLIFGGISRQAVKFKLFLSDAVDTEAITAKCNEGILTIMLPGKAEAVPPERQIEIG